MKVWITSAGPTYNARMFREKPTKWRGHERGWAGKYERVPNDVVISILKSGTKFPEYCSDELLEWEWE